MILAKLYRESDHHPITERAVLRTDGIHFIDRWNGQEDEMPSYKTVDEMNETLRKLGYGTFQVVASRQWPAYHLHGAKIWPKSRKSSKASKNTSRRRGLSILV